MNTNNLILNVDSYKAEGHWEQYPPNTTKIFSYIESRGCNFSSEMMMFGLQMFIKEYLSKPITQSDIDEANEIFMAHGGSFNKEGWQFILDNYNGFLPVSIKAVPEGMIVPTHSVLVTVENTDPACYWLTSYLETALLRAVWYPSTVASNCFYLKRQIYNALHVTSDNPDNCGLEFKLHSFGFRGVSSLESGGIGDVAHLVSFRGTDTMAGITFARKYYECDMAGFSIKASEHSTQTSWGRANERDAYKNLVDKYAAPGAIFASVIDSYDTFGAIDIYADTGLLDTVKERGATIVIRPDCYDDQTQILTQHGWKYFKDVTYADKVASIDSNNTISFVIPNKIMDYQYSGDMYCFNDAKGKVDICVTPNHRMVQYKSNKNLLTVKEAQDCSWYFGTGVLIASNTFSGESITPYEQFLVAFQADGSFSSGEDEIINKINDYTTVRFNFAKKRKVERLVSILNNTDLKFTVSTEPARPQNTQIYVKVPNNKILSKTFDWVQPLNKSKEWNSSFVQELKYWDAHQRSPHRFKYDTTVLSNVEPIKLVCALSGHSCHHSYYDDNRSEKFSRVHTLHIMDTPVIGGQAIHTSIKNYTGKVYCVNVDSGMILVRRNAGPLVCGNSGDPMTMPCDVIEYLMSKPNVGYTVNSKGYKVLPPHVRVIQGDGVNVNSVPKILKNMMDRGLSIENIALGMGAGMLQQVDRDTYKMAMKCSYAEINGEGVDVYKQPSTDPNKTSKRGHLTLVQNDSGGIITKRTGDVVDADTVLLREVYNCGPVESAYEALETIRKRSDGFLL